MTSALYAYARHWPVVVPARHWPVVVPAWATAGGLAATLLIGAVAGLYPAVPASRLAPTTALAGP